MQVVEKKMAEGMGIPVVEFKFNQNEVSERNKEGECVALRDETAFKKRLEDFLLEHGIA